MLEMNSNRHFNVKPNNNGNSMIKRFILFLLLLSLAQAELIKPTDSKISREILTISGKRRVYQNLHKDELTYTINGPAIIRVISRKALAKKSKKSQPFEYEITIDSLDATTIKHRQKISKGVTASEHPNHYFTKSAVDVIRIEKGVHSIIFKAVKGPIVIRVLQDNSSKNLKRKSLRPFQKSENVKIQIGKKSLSYYPLFNDSPMEVELSGPATFELVTRLGFEYWMTGAQNYRIQIYDNGHLAGTYYFSTVMSEGSRIVGEDTLMPGKWRSCTVKLSEGEHRLKIKLLDKDRRIFLRMNKLDEKDKK